MSRAKPRKKYHRSCVQGCCPGTSQPSFDNDSQYCVFVAPNGNSESLENNSNNPSNPPLPSSSNPENSKPAGINTTSVTNNIEKDETVEEKDVKSVGNDDTLKQAISVKQDLTIKNQNLVPKDLQNNQSLNHNSKCSDPKCNDRSCRVEVGSKTGVDKSCGELCSDENCSGCEHDHGSTARNTFLGIAGVLIIAIIGYLSFIRMKTRRSKASKTLSSINI